MENKEKKADKVDCSVVTAWVANYTKYQFSITLNDSEGDLNVKESGKRAEKEEKAGNQHEILHVSGFSSQYNHNTLILTQFSYGPWVQRL